jgi:hypothetical protein
VSIGGKKRASLTWEATDTRVAIREPLESRLGSGETHLVGHARGNVILLVADLGGEHRARVQRVLQGGAAVLPERAVRRAVRSLQGGAAVLPESR